MDQGNSKEKIDELLLEKGNEKVYSKVICDTEKMLIERALKRSFGNQSIAAKLLGINRNTLRIKIKKMKISVKEFKI